MSRHSLAFSLSRFAARFSREEEGAAMIIFAIFLGLIVLGLLAVNVDLGRSFGRHTEIRSRLEEYSTFLAQEYGELHNKLEFCKSSPGADCSKNADVNARVFGDSLDQYDVSTDGSGGSNQKVLAAMEGFLKDSFTKNSGKLRFQQTDLETDIRVKATSSCASSNRVMLTFTVTAAQFKTFLKTGPQDMVVKVDRLTAVPCSGLPAGPSSPGTNDSKLTPTGSGSGPCAHANPKPTDAYTSTELNDVDALNARSVVNFVFSLDRRSRSDVTTDFVYRIGNALTRAAEGINPGNKIATGLTLGNFPMQGGGAPACKDNGSGMASSGSCYDAKDTFDGPVSTDLTEGYANTTRKDPVWGEIVLQHTRRCPKANAAWTYQTVSAGGNCNQEHYEDFSYSYGTDNYEWESKVPASMASYQSQTATIAANCVNDAGATDGQYAYYSIQDANVADTTLCPGTTAIVGDRCQRYHVVLQCIRPVNDFQPVYTGEWYRSCRSSELGTTGTDIYGDPVDIAKVRAHLVADLDGKPVPSTTKVDLVAVPERRPDASKYDLVSVDGNYFGQKDELADLHVKNTERSFYWACDRGPRQADGTLANNNGNLGAPYGVKVDSARQILNNSGTASTSVADSANNSGGCSIPLYGALQADGRIKDTVQTYNLFLNRENAPLPAHMPEGMYALSLETQRSLDTGGRPDDAERMPKDGLKTTWKPAGTIDKWTWGPYGTVTALNGICPKDLTVSSNGIAGCRQTISGINGTYCKVPAWKTTGQANLADCNDEAGTGCPNFARYMLNKTAANETIHDTNTQERLNVGVVAMERRRVEALNHSPTPYGCVIERGETVTSGRSGYAYLWNGATSKCDWTQGDPFFCVNRSNGTVWPGQEEESFIDKNKGGILSLTANDFNNALKSVPLGDDKEQFSPASGNLPANYAARRITASGATAFKAPTDNNLSLMPLQVQSLEPVYYRNSDLPPDNIAIKSGQANLLEVTKTLAKGFVPYESLLNENDPANLDGSHRGNQCALLKQGARALWSTDVAGGVKTSKFLVYIGALPQQADVIGNQFQDKGKWAQHVSSAGSPGTFDTTTLSLAGTRSLITDTNDADFPLKLLNKCFGTVDEDVYTSPFIITALPTADANDKTKAAALIDALKDATSNVSNESCKRPYCVLSNTEGGGWEMEGVMTPETCAAKLWKCISPPTTR